MWEITDLGMGWYTILVANKFCDIWPGLPCEEWINLRRRLDGKDYWQYFAPMESEDSISDFIYEARNAKKDQYWSILHLKKHIGFFMLRGFDKGYKIPAYGVYIAKPYSGKGYGRFTLACAEEWCRAHHIPELMLTCHPKNMAGNYLYKLEGFKKTNEKSKRGEHIWRKKLV